MKQKSFDEEVKRSGAKNKAGKIVFHVSYA